MLPLYNSHRVFRCLLPTLHLCFHLGVLCGRAFLRESLGDSKKIGWNGRVSLLVVKECFLLFQCESLCGAGRYDGNAVSAI